MIKYCHFYPPYSPPTLPEEARRIAKRLNVRQANNLELSIYIFHTKYPFWENMSIIHHEISEKCFLLR